MGGSMKLRKFAGLLAGVGLIVAAAPTGVEAAAKAKVKVMMTGDCADGKMVENTDEDDCQIMVSVTPKSKNVSAVLEVSYDETDVEWEELDSGRTRGGRLVFDLPATDEDDAWMDGVLLYHVIVKKAAGVTVPATRDYTVEYVSADNASEDDTALSEEDKAFNEEMDKAQAENKQKIQQQQPNAPIYQQAGNKGGGNMGMNGQQNNGPMTQQQFQQNQQDQKNGQGGFDKNGVFNRACGSIQFPQDKCQLLVAAKSPKEAFTILGDQAEKWCAAVAEAAGKKGSCDMVMPNVFPPIGPNNGQSGSGG